MNSVGLDKKVLDRQTCPLHKKNEVLDTRINTLLDQTSCNFLLPDYLFHRKINITNQPISPKKRFLIFLYRLSTSNSSTPVNKSKASPAAT